MTPADNHHQASRMAQQRRAREHDLGIVEVALRERLLAFPLGSVRRLVEHVRAAEQHWSPYGPAEEPALLWVKDHGIYLTGNSRPPLFDPDDERRQQVVYAVGGEPPDPTFSEWSEVYDRITDLCGGDDFIEEIVLDETLLAGLQATANRGHTHFVVTLSGNEYRVGTARIIPDVEYPEAAPDL